MRSFLMPAKILLVPFGGKEVDRINRLEEERVFPIVICNCRGVGE